MPAIEFPKGLTETENLPKTKRTLVNCFNNNQGQIISRPGISSITTTGRVARGQFVWNGSLYQIQSEELHKITNLITGASTLIGTIAGAEPVFVAIGFNTATIIVKGGSLYTLDTSDVLTDISSNSNFVPCDAIAHINGRFVYIPSNGDPAFFSDVGAAGTVQVLSFFDAEELPDKNNSVFNFKNTLYIMGTDSIELFRDTGASPNPFGRISGSRITNGFIGGLLEYNETFLFIGREKDQSAGIYAIGSGIAPKISNDAIDLILAGFTEAQMALAVTSRFKWRGYDIATFTILTTTFAFFGGNWFELTTLVDSVPGVWQGGFINQFEGTYYTADKGNIGKLAKVNTDYGGKIERIIDIGFQDPNNDFFTCQSIELVVSQGFNVSSIVGDGGDGGDGTLDLPVVEVFILPGSGATLDITTINGINVSNFSMVMGTLTGLNVSGVPTALGIRLSSDGGSTFDAATTFYNTTYVSGAEIDPWTVRNNLIMHTGLVAAATNELLFMLYELNTAGFPVTYNSAEMSPVSNGDQKQWSGYYDKFVAVNAFQLVLTGGTSPELTAGTLRLEGFR